MTQSIPASDIANVIPAVLEAGGRGLDTIGLLLTTSDLIPIGSVPSFPDADSVGDYFGSLSDEKLNADIYFGGFENSDVKPAALLMAQYNESRASAWLRSQPSGLTLAQMKAITTGAITITVDGSVYAVTGINLSGATSFSSVADLIETALDAAAPAGASFTGVVTLGPGGGGVLTASAVTGTIALGSTLGGSGIIANTIITAQLSGTTGGAGVYSLDTPQTHTSEAMTSSSHGPDVSYDGTLGTFRIQSHNNGQGSTITYATGTLAVSLKFQQSDGAIISQGAKAADPQTFMDSVKTITQDWVGFTTIFNPDSDGTPTQKLLFAAWTNAQNDAFAYIPWDPDAAPAAASAVTTSLGYQVNITYGYEGVACVWSPDCSKAVFALGVGGSIAWDQTEGRITWKFKTQSGLTADVTDLATANNLRSNGYNFYGAWATRNDRFVGYADGRVSGKFLWLDSYYDQIWLNNALQLALVSLMFTIKSMPYTQKGYSLIHAACADPINAGLNNGVIRVGVTLSSAQTAEINNAAGNQTAAQTVQNQGWYLQVQDATAQVRAQRGSPPCKFWYTDGQSIHKIDLTSVTVL